MTDRVAVRGSYLCDNCRPGVVAAAHACIEIVADTAADTHTRAVAIEELRHAVAMLKLPSTPGTSGEEASR